MSVSQNTAAVLVVVDMAALAGLVALGMVVVALLAADPVLKMVREPVALVFLAVLVVPMAPKDWDALEVGFTWREKWLRHGP
jgi:hypothetical protein